MRARVGWLVVAVALGSFAACSLKTLDELQSGSGPDAGGSHGDGSPEGAAGAAAAAGAAGSGGSAADASTDGGGTSPDGATCGIGAECLSGFCVDGVCCNSACEATCQACSAALKGGGSDGECGPAQAGTDPHNQCSDQGVASCGNDGRCDGLGACRNYPLGIECEAQTCTNGVKTLAKTCDGQGRCTDNGTQNCNPQSCDGIGCTGDCTSDAACQVDEYCDLASGNCLAKAADGTSCLSTKPNQCLSGHCVDGVCCESGCSGVCESCAGAFTGTTDGLCSPTISGTDPDSDCADQGAAGCGTNGACDGARGCALYANGTQCAAGSCSGSTLTLPSSCDGQGTCNAGSTSSCNPYRCAGSTCGNSCTTNADCTTGNACIDGSCGGKLGNGSSCGAGTECSSGYCVDGYCCNGGCTGTCEACAQSLTGATNGSCAPIPAGSDPDGDCSSQSASTCGRTGDCNGSRGCELYPAGTVCVPAGCANTTSYAPADTCDGSGNCQDNGTQGCGAYDCSGGVCLTSCTSNAECASSYVCSNNRCILSNKPLGSPCVSGSECASGFCVDRVCCESSCTGLCMACDGQFTIKGAGYCSGIECADPKNECVNPEICTGAGGCGLYCV